jgi:hypothetical protein
MLVQTEKGLLGDTYLSWDEEQIRQEEKTEAQVAAYREHRQEELEDEDRASGPRLQFGELISKLRRICPQLKVVDGVPGSVALYYPCDRQELPSVTAQRKREGVRDPFFFAYKYVGGFPKHDLPEYGYILTDDHRLMTDEVRGWRTVVLRLITAGIVSYKSAIKEFGDANGPRAWRWHRDLRNVRK